MQDPSSSFPVAMISSYLLIGLAEIGDKSQLVCMTLAARHRAWPVFLAAVVAFCALNLVAVIFGAAVSQWLPGYAIDFAVGMLFLLFGLHLWINATETESMVDQPVPARSLFLGTLLMITLAEFGDKTQIAVAALAGAYDPYPVWIGATLALASISAIGVWSGRAIVRFIPLKRLHQVSGVLFILFAIMVFYRFFAATRQVP